MSNKFKDIGISKDIENILNRNGIKEPMPVQEKAIPKILRGKDIIGQAQTGTGKTLAFILPIIEKIDIDSSNIQSLIITPTRELALQITNEAKKIIPAKEVNILAAYGGKDVKKQINKLNKNIHMVIGTPGRLLDLIRRGSIDFSNVKTLVLDEADQMLHMGFLKDVEEIIHETPKKRQTLFFSATIPKEIRSLSLRYMRKPDNIQIKGNNIILDEIKQIVIQTTEREKEEVLCKAIDEYRPFMAIIFCRTKRRVKQLHGALKSKGYDVDELHGDLSQAKRERVLKVFRQAKKQLLVATDVASRGIDVEGITHVFNYDIPRESENYIHRIGRTGRAGDTGIAITLVTSKDKADLLDIEKRINHTIEKHKQ